MHLCRNLNSVIITDIDFTTVVKYAAFASASNDFFNDLPAAGRFND